MLPLKQPQQRNRLSVTFDMDRPEELPTLANGQPFQLTEEYSLFNRRRSNHLCYDVLNPKFLNENRRHSADVRSIGTGNTAASGTATVKLMGKVTRANSDLLLNSFTTNSNSNESNLTAEKLEAQKQFEAKRTNAAIKKLAKYINIRIRLKHKEHNYQRMNNIFNIKANKCRICSTTIYFHGYECIQCKLKGHKKCLHNLYVKCPNRIMPPRLAVFGLEISDNNQISEVLSISIMEIEKRPIHELRRIYKMPGNGENIKNLCLSFEFGSHLIDLSQVSPHDIAGIIKEYLFRISTPFFNASLQKELIAIGRDWPVRKVPYTPSGIAILVFELRRLIKCLSPAYRNNLAYFIYHLKRIVDRQHITEMTANSLSIIFVPIIFRNESKKEMERIMPNPSVKKEMARNKASATGTTNTGVQILLDITLKIRVIELMIIYANDIFSDLE